MPLQRGAASAETKRSTVRRLALGSLLVALVVGSTTPTSLWPLYQARLDYGAGATTLLFTCYLMTLVPATLIAGRVVYGLGRRGPLSVSVLLAGVSLWALGNASSFAWLAAGRLLQGLAVGAGAPPLTSALLAVAPRANRTGASLLVTVAITTAAGFGAVLSGVLVGDGQPVRAYAVAGGLLALTAFPALALLPPEAPRESRVTGVRRRNFLDDPVARRQFARASARSLLAWAIGYASLAVAPSFGVSVLHSNALLLVGAPAGLLLVISAAVQVLAARVRSESAARFGLLSLGLGLLVLSIVPFLPSIELLAASLAVLGVGHGLVFMTALRDAIAAAPPADDAKTAAVFFTVTYLGGGLTVLGIGALSTFVGLVAALQVFCLCGAVVAIVHVRLLMGVNSAAQNVGLNQPRML